MSTSTFDCACCGPADAPASVLATLCDVCAAGACAQCNGLRSGAETSGSGYVESPTSVCAVCDGIGVVAARPPIAWGVCDEAVCYGCSGAGYTSDPSHGLTSMSPSWCHYLSLTLEECSNV